MFQLSTKRVLITGGSGFIGTNLVAYFEEQGALVRNLDIVSPRNEVQLAYWKKVDLLDHKRVLQAFQRFQPTVVLHFAARTDLDEKCNLAGYAVNIEGVCNVIDAIRATPSVERVIFASSQLVCRLDYTPADEYDYQPKTLYGQSKMLTERIVRSADDIGAIWTIVRPTSIWGPWFDRPYKSFFLAIAGNRYVHPGKTITKKQWGFVGNTVYQVRKLISCSPSAVHKKTFYLADYEPVELRDFADKVQNSFQSRPIKTVPRKTLELAGSLGHLVKKAGWRNPPLTSFRYHNLVTPELQNVEPLRRIVGPLPYTTEQGIQMTIQWLREQEHGKNREASELARESNRSVRWI